MTFKVDNIPLIARYMFGRKRNFQGKKLLVAAIIISALVAFSGSYFLEKEEQPAIASNLTESNLFINQKGISKIENPEIAFVQKNSLAGISCSQIFSTKVLGGLIEGGEVEQRNKIEEYVVQPGDSLGSIADKFDISLSTLLWANDLSSKSVIQPGQKLVVLPVSGVIHHVKKGDTLGEIAETYEAETSKIIAFNDLSEEGEIFIGDILVIPGGERPSYLAYQPSAAKIPVASSYFIVPVASPYRITQWLHWYNAIDFANEGGSCGKPVFAAAGGEVLKVKYGYNGGAGNYVRILHPNGLITHYGHLQSSLVKVGENVSQGDIVGLIGCTGHTIPAGNAGCHLHFALYSSTGNPPLNPFAR